VCPPIEEKKCNISCKNVLYEGDSLNTIDIIAGDDICKALSQIDTKILNIIQGSLAKKAYINYFDFTSEAVTTINNADEWTLLNTTTTQGFSNNGLVHTNNRVTNTGVKKIFKVEGIASVSSGNNNEIHFAFFKNGSLFPCSVQSVVTTSGGRSSAIPFHCLVELDKTDYVEVFIKNSTSDTNVTLHNVNVIITQQ
jgi:hypothetical protein